METVTTVDTGNNSLGSPTEKNDSGILNDFFGVWPILVAVVLVVLLAMVIPYHNTTAKESKEEEG